MEVKNKTEALEQYRKKLESFADISDYAFNLLADAMHEKHFNKGEVIQREGKVCRHFYFIIRGCVRSFGLNDGKEVNVNFYFEDDFACDFASFREEVPSEFYMVAMEDCFVYATAKTDIMPVFENETSLHMFLFRFFQALFFKEEEHSNSFKLLSPEERYQYMIEHNSHYLQRIPMIYLASYLGISRETLTRIRKKIS